MASPKSWKIPVKDYESLTDVEKSFYKEGEDKNFRYANFDENPPKKIIDEKTAELKKYEELGGYDKFKSIIDGQEQTKREMERVQREAIE